MRLIRKLPEPRSLKEHRATPGATYEDYRDKLTLRENLVREQRGLCCYCLARIQPGVAGNLPPMKIAHWHSQSLHEDEQLNYQNLLGACCGNEGMPPGQQHCDTRQGNRDIKFNPANPEHHIEDRVTYLEDGAIKSGDPEFNEQLDAVLNLNAKFLQRRRREKLEIFLTSLGNAELKRPRLLKMLSEWNGDSHATELEPDCQIVVSWLRKRLRRV